MISTIDKEIARAYSELLSLYSKMSYEGINGGLARRLVELVELIIERVRRYGVELPCV